MSPRDLNTFGAAIVPSAVHSFRLITLSFLVSAAVGATAMSAHAAELGVGKRAPDFRLENLKGALISSRTYAGRPMVLVVGTSKLAAESCREWMLTLQKNFKETPAVVFQVIVLNKAWYIPAFAVVNELEGFVPAHGHRLVLLEWKTHFGDIFGIPYDHDTRVIVVEPSGTIRHWYRGAMTDEALSKVVTLVSDMNVQATAAAEPAP
jgi:hypothetical protein